MNIVTLTPYTVLTLLHCVSHCVSHCSHFVASFTSFTSFTSFLPGVVHTARGPLWVVDGRDTGAGRRRAGDGMDDAHTVLHHRWVLCDDR